MPKLGMEPIRRRQLIQATIRTIHAEGLDRTSLTRIGRQAGMSPGIVAHYFGDKAGLLEATMRWLGTALHQEVTARLEAATTPLERVQAVIDANFAETQFVPELITTWLAFWSAVPHVPNLARIQRVIRGRLENNLRHGLRELVPAESVDRITEVLVVVIDGLWLRAAITDCGLDAATARAHAHNYLETQIPQARGPAR